MNGCIKGITAFLLLALCLLQPAAAASNNVLQGKQDAQASDQWAELEAFHEIMSQTFHAAEKGQFEPIRKRAGEMATRAKKWLDSKPPAIYDVPSIREKLVRLNAESKALSDAIANGLGDERIMKDLTALHDRFHEIIGACRDEKKKHQ